MHQCKEVCCVGRNMRDFEGHLCLQRCEKLLTCGMHVCDNLCHQGPCTPCEVRVPEGVGCTCGFIFLPGPIRCAQRESISCPQPCTQFRECGHPCNLKCHKGPCAPCTKLVSKYCAGNHRVFNCVPCGRTPHCEKKCDQIRRCGIHKCKRKCHSENCEDEKLSQELIESGSC